MLNALNAKTVSYGQEIKTSCRNNVLTTAGAIQITDNSPGRVLGS